MIREGRGENNRFDRFGEKGKAGLKKRQEGSTPRGGCLLPPMLEEKGETIVGKGGDHVDLRK